jgi:hypothetical protein
MRVRFVASDLGTGSIVEAAVDDFRVFGFRAGPDCDGARALVPELWPPNHKLVPVTIAGVTGADGGPVTITVTSIAQDEPVGAGGDGGACPDGVIGPDGRAEVRAERSGAGNGRVYTVGFRADDGHGGVCDGSVEVRVPHDRASRCVKDRLAVNSLGPCGAAPRDAAPETVVAPELRVAGGTGRAMRIEFALPEAADITIAVFDVAGRRVATLASGRHEAGRHEVAWDAAGVAGGMYFCRMQAGAVTLARTALRVR